MTIWIDGDACPKAIKTICFRAAIRTQTPLIIVSNHPLQVPASMFIKTIQVGFGFDVVDQYIVSQVQAHDLVITADIPFAYDVICKEGLALNPRGELYTKNNIKPLLAKRNNNEMLRGAGLISGGAAALHAKDIQKFSNQLDAYTRNLPKCDI